MNSYTFPILRLLADGQFHSGEALAARLGVTRATVWNALQDAEKMGVTLFSVRGRGYRLPYPLHLLDEAQVAQGLKDYRARFALQLFDQLDSTNAHLMNEAANGAAHGTCVAATWQTAGRGRRGRAWQAGLGAGLTFSLLWRFQCGAGALSGLSLAVGLALVRALAELGVTGVALKWPNDLLFEGRKLAGILIELQGDMDGPSAAVIGIGLNLHLPAAVREAIDQPVVDLQELLGSKLNASEVLAAVLRHLADVLQVFETRGFEALQQEWMDAHAYQGQPVRLLMPDGRMIHGVAAGVAGDGALLLTDAQGTRRYAAGEISMRSAA